MTHVVVVADRIAGPGFALLEAEPRLRIVSTVDRPERLPEALRDAHALIVRSSTRVTDDLIAGAPHLKVIARAGTGVDNVDLAAATRRGVAVLNAPGANTVSAAEHTIALLLALFRRIPEAAASMRCGQWDRKRFAGTELRGKTLGIVGLGRIGLHVAAVGRAFGMQVLAHDPYLSEERARQQRVELLELDALLERADVVTLHLPLTERTRHLLDRERLARMKPTAVVVNTARGALIDEQALVEAVEQGRLGGAALDVFDPEPLPEDSPLRSVERILTTPHLAASTSEAQERVAQEICVAVRDALLSGAVGNAVNLPGVSTEVLARLTWVLDLAKRLGRLAIAVAQGPVRKVVVFYGGDDDAAPRPTMVSALEGVLSGMGVSPVSLVNALMLAEDRGMNVERRVGQPFAGFETTVGVELRTADRTVGVIGALMGERVARVIRIDGFAVDVPAQGCILVLKNRDVPGVIGRVGTLLGEERINIASYHQSRMESPGSEALAAIVVDQVPDTSVLERLAGLQDILEVRFANLGG